VELSIQDYGSIGELVAAFATIATLIYLAAQIRQNTRHIASSSLQGLSGRVENRLLTIASDKELARIWTLWIAGEDLEEDECSRAELVFASWINDVEDAYRQFALGMIPEQALKARATNMLTFFMSSQRAQTFIKPRLCVQFDRG